MARILSPDYTPAPFDHYDEQGRPIDSDGNVMTGAALAPTNPGVPDWQIATGAGAAPAGTYLPDWRPGEPDQAGATDATGTPYPVVTPPPTSTTTPPPTSGGGTGGGATTGGGDTSSVFGPWTGHYTAPANQPLPDVPVFTPPTYTPPPAFDWNDSHPLPTYTAPAAFSYADFQQPSVEEALKDPGYQFRVQQGTEALQFAAAARGTLADSGTLKALQDYGQNAASQEYQNVWNRDYTAYGANRTNALDTYNTNYKTQYTDPYATALDSWKTGHDTALDTYNTNYKTQYTDPYSYAYQAARDAFAPQLTAYTTNAANVQHQNDVANTNSWNDYMATWQDFEARRNLGANFALGS